MTLGVCTIVGHELGNLPVFLSQVRQFADQIVIVETQEDEAQSAYLDAQEDVTRGRFDWCDDFSKARNAAIDLCTCDYIMSVDPDSIFGAESMSKMDGFIARLDKEKKTIYFGSLLNHSADGNTMVESGIRVFPNRPDIRYSYRVHEDISPSLASIPDKKFASSPIVINHRVPQGDKDKLLYYADLIRRDLADGQDKARCYSYLSMTAMALGKHKECIDAGYLVMDHDENRRWLRRVMNSVAEAYRKLGDREGSVLWMEEIAQMYPEDGMVQYYYGTTLALAGKHKEAVAQYIKAAKLNMVTDCISIPANINEALLFNLGSSLRKANDHKTANIGYLAFLGSVIHEMEPKPAEKPSKGLRIADLKRASA